MGKIVILDENTSNKIAAGEVVERPASVVKELVENSIDAGAGNVSVEIKNGGISFIKVTDNGSGIDEDDVEIAFERHATSKIRNSDDLDSILTMGFRGEALASIASVSSVELTTRVQKNPHGTYIKIQGGSVKDVRQTGCPVGTTFIIRDLFYNTPARYKFLKKDSTEAGYISDILSRMALGNPQISFRLISSNSTVMHTPGNNDLLSTIFSIYGKDTAKEVAEIKYTDNKIKISGYAGKPEIARSNRNQQSIFINGRYIKSKVITSAVDEAYKTFLMKNKFPFIVMKIELNPMLVDVNVHPTKMEIRFAEEQYIFSSVYHAVSNALLGRSYIKEASIAEKDRDVFKFKENPVPKPNYVQQSMNFREHTVKEKSLEGKPVEIKTQSMNSLPKAEDNIIGKTAAAYPASIPYPAPIKEASKKSDLYENRQKGLTKPYSVQEDFIPPEDACSSSNTVIEAEKTVEEDKRPETALQAEKQELEQRVEYTTCQEENTAEAPVNPLLDAVIVGQAFSTYIILQKDNELILVDQHAAHERIMYERLKEKYLRNESMSQQLLAPAIVELTHQEIKLMEEEKDFFNKLGFTYENFGNNSIIIRSVPYNLDGVDLKDMLLEVVDQIISAGKADYRKTADETIYTIACKAAVKANKRLDEMEIKSILKGLSEIENPYTCPHGRPTAVKLTKYELEKMFKRIV